MSEVNGEDMNKKAKLLTNQTRRYLNTLPDGRLISTKSIKRGMNLPQATYWFRDVITTLQSEGVIVLVSRSQNTDLWQVKPKEGLSTVPASEGDQ